LLGVAARLHVATSRLPMRFAMMARSTASHASRTAAAAAFERSLIDGWFDELTTLSRRRTDDRSAIDAHIEHFLDAARDWQQATGEDAARQRELMLAAIDRALNAPWPKPRRFRAHLSYAGELLRATRNATSDHVKQVKQNDYRNRDTQKPQQRAAHDHPPGLTKLRR
jgi:hypothetical protein